jgi:hypothetical protein
MLSEGTEIDPRHSEPRAGSGRALERCLDRLASIVETESRLLKEGGRLDFDALNARKTHALLELTLASRSARRGELAGLDESARRLREALAANAEILERRLRATQEIAMLILVGIRNDESDGTYTVGRLAARGR